MDDLQPVFFAVFLIVWVVALVGTIHRMNPRRKEQLSAARSTEPAPPADPQVARRFRRNRNVLVASFVLAFASGLAAVGYANIVRNWYPDRDEDPTPTWITGVFIVGAVGASVLLWRCPAWRQEPDDRRSAVPDRTGDQILSPLPHSLRVSAAKRVGMTRATLACRMKMDRVPRARAW